MVILQGHFLVLLEAGKICVDNYFVNNIMRVRKAAVVLFGAMHHSLYCVTHQLDSTKAATFSQKHEISVEIFTLYWPTAEQHSIV